MALNGTMSYSCDVSAGGCVINQQLIRDGIQIDDDATTSAEEKRQTIEFEDVSSLSLSFRSVVAIGHIEGLHALTKLQLDNNRLKKIENLDALIHLEWLDLSFNEIERIEGLDSLKKLTDLSLFGNKIKRIENLEALEHLQILSMGNNRICVLEDIDHLRQFRELRVLGLSENPVCNKEGYRSYVLSRLDALESLDYKRIAQSEISEAKEQHQDAMIEILEREEKEKEIALGDSQQTEEREFLSRANLLVVHELFDKMESEDPEWQRLKEVSGLLELWTETKNKFNTASEEFKTAATELLERRKAETDLWNRAVQSYLKDSTSICRRAISRFEKEKKALLWTVGNLPSHAFSSLKANLMHLKQTLLETEEEVQETLKQFNAEYESALSDIHAKRNSLYATYFTQVRDMLNGLSNGLNSAALSAFERVHLDGDLDKLPDAARSLLREKDVLVAALQNSQDFRVNLIDVAEEECVQGETAQTQCLCDALSLNEKRRHRDRMSEILGYVSRSVAETEAALSEGRVAETESVPRV